VEANPRRPCGVEWLPPPTRTIKHQLSGSRSDSLTQACAGDIPACGEQGEVLSELTLETVYRCAYGRDVAPYPFQRAIADTPEADILIAPTGLGKTAAVTLGWAWRRLKAPSTTPRRLVWCLPMRTLVEQTEREARSWMKNLSVMFAGATPSVHSLMGGAADGDWRLQPENPAIIVGTQDMLLSRALMRGYGMSRFGWPIDYGLLHSDVLWVYDEVQLMGAGLATSAQLEAFRRRHRQHSGLARSLWVSATLDPEWLKTAEFRSEIPNPVVLRWNDGNAPEPPGLSARLDAIKHLRKAQTTIGVESIKKPEVYARSLAQEVASIHRSGTTTLVVLNTVERAQAVYGALADVLGTSTTRLLIHSRYRPPERRELEKCLRDGARTDRVVVATQAVEAGVDMTSAVLFTELAPGSSMVQRFGRCNRAGECNEAGGAEIRWIDAEIDTDSGLTKPYEVDELRTARAVLATLDDARPRNLPPPSPPRRPIQVIRPKDFEELFDTDADLSGYDLDISPYIRDDDAMSVSLFWRAVGGENKDGRIVAERPQRDELCAAPLGKPLQSWLGVKDALVYVEDPLSPDAENWIRLDKSDRRLRPGLTLLVDVGMGGYDPVLGFVGAEATAPVESVAKEAALTEPDDTGAGITTGDDTLSFDFKRAVALEGHLDDVAECARKIAKAIALPATEAKALIRAGAWHDLGKVYAPFQTLLGRASNEPPLAKSIEQKAPTERQRQAKTEGLRKFFRHELASALAFLQQHDGEPDADLVAFLIAAHHGKVRMGLRALPGERPDSPELRLARGVQDGDRLEGLRCGDEISTSAPLDLSLMEMGEDEHGRPSWTERTQALLAQYGPFRLAYLEALIRMADWRASADEQKGIGHDE
jgi:CRISPR-associated endonuclease/helicase Cas3